MNFSLLQSFHSVGPQRFEPCDQRPVGTIAFPNPNQLDRLGAQKPMVNEVLVLADDDSVLTSGVLPNHRVIGGLQTDVEDMRGRLSLADNPACQRAWKLRYQ